jgi:hypothetical protein
VDLNREIDAGSLRQAIAPAGFQDHGNHVVPRKSRLACSTVRRTG